MINGLSISWLLTILLLSPLVGEELQLNQLIDNVHEKFRQQSNYVKSFTCNGSTLYQEFLNNGRLEKEIWLTRRLYTKGTDHNFDEYLEMSLNGKVLDRSEIEEQIDEWNRRGKKRGTTNMPLRPQTEAFYNYSLLTDTVWNEKPVYRIGFKARPGIDDVINGLAYVDQSDFDLIRIEASPAKTSGVIKMMKMVYHYAPVNGYMLPDSFCFEMKIKVKFLINFFERYIKLSDVYTNYKLNVAIPDSLFNKNNR